MAMPKPPPFERPKFRQLLTILGLLWLGALGVVRLSQGLGWLPLNFSEPIAILILYLLLFGGSSLWVVWQYRRHRINLRSLIGPWPSRRQWRTVLSLWVTLFIFSMGSFQVSYTLISWVWPEPVEAVLQQSLFLSAAETSVPWLYNTLLLGILVIGAPVLEEFLFRGFLLHRWGTRWPLAVAVMLSSGLFGLLHSNVIGLSAFGLVMALLYLRSRSLGLVVGIHSLNNAIAAGLEILTRLLGGGLTPSLDTFRANLWLGVMFLFVSTPFLVRFVRQNWRITQAPLPYFAHHNRTP
ncbi:MAG: CPBP family intramembrane metalloprotease [Leptolyngbya sp. SIO1E4]|nr:CPBP family intramembrane metalloprotease [Leptolyngbya sp. SIO1E4]